jgi:hypothetical protein
MIKRTSAAVFLILCLLISFGCSSTPSGTIAIRVLQKDAAKYLGKNVVVVGSADIRGSAPLAPQMFKLSNKDGYIWVSRPESAYSPDQERQVRVTGILQQKRLNIFGEVYYIEASKVEVE